MVLVSMRCKPHKEAESLLLVSRYAMPLGIGMPDAYTQ